MELRSYQNEMYNQIVEKLKDSDSIIAVLPTGGGKTAILAHISKYIVDNYSSDYDLLIISPRIEVCKQIEETIKKLDVDTRYIHIATPVSAMKFATKTNLASSQRPFYLIIDEAHHSKAATYLSAKNKAYKTIGFTATPIFYENREKQTMHGYFSDIVHGPCLSYLVENEYLSIPYVFGIPTVDQMELKTQHGKDDVGKSFKANDKKEKYDTIIEAYDAACEKIGKKLKIMVFCITRQHGKEITEKFKSKGHNAEYCDANTKQKDRDRIVEGFKNGVYDILVNVELFGEGFDAPSCDAVLLARPTSSEILFNQQCGRALRKSDNKKYGVIIDCAGNFERNVNSTTLCDVEYNLIENDVKVKKDKSIGKSEIIETSAEKERQKQATITYTEDQGVVKIIKQDELFSMFEKRYKKTRMKEFIDFHSTLSEMNISFSQYKMFVFLFAKKMGYKDGFVKVKMSEWKDCDGNYICMQHKMNENYNQYVEKLKYQYA